MPEYSSPLFPIPTGIPQGSPLSPILYLIYNSYLVEDSNISREEANQATYRWVDNMGLMA
jgi:hypothetical protein